MGDSRLWGQTQCCFGLGAGWVVLRTGNDLVSWPGLDEQGP